jgi:alanyl-tRNA synthetase
LHEIEDLVNEQILLDSPVTTELLSFDDAVERGAMALFGEKYGDEVRVLSMGGSYSVELCGGTHVSRTGDIGLFKIQLESGIAAGIRRIEAVSGEGALAVVSENDNLIASIGHTLKVGVSEINSRIIQILAENKALSREVEQLGQKIAASKSSDLGDQVEHVNGVDFIAAHVEGDNKAMMQTLDTLRSQLSEDSVIVLAQVASGKVGLVVSVSKSITEKIKAPELLSAIAAQVGAKGGGRPDLARAGGGTNPDGVMQALADAHIWVRDRLAN